MDRDRRSTPSGEEDSGGRDTPASGISVESSSSAPRNDAPLGPLPKYQYSRDKLLQISETDTSKRRHQVLSKDYDSPEGYWDPEKWIRSFDKTSSRGSSPLTLTYSRDRKRPMDMERDLLFKRRPSDPKTRLKEEEADNFGIVLSPQRRSFGTGCHVSTQPTNNRRPGSPTEGDRDSRDRRNESGQRRIGSGRIHIDRDRDRERDRDRDRDRDRERDTRVRDTRDFRDPRNRFDRDDRFDRDERFRRDDRRDYRDRRYNSYGGNRHRREEEEPEWFSAGPMSQSDTIELRGFESHSHQHHEQEVKPPPAPNKSKPPAHNRNRHQESKNVADRNGSLETNESSSPEGPEGGMKHAVGDAPEFDVNEFFKIDNIPGLSENQMVEEPDHTTAGGSRFSRWFSIPQGPSGGSHPGSREHSRRSSINEEFSHYLTDLVSDLVSGQKSPVIPSPPPGGEALTANMIENKQHLLDLLTNSGGGIPNNAQYLTSRMGTSQPPNGHADASDIEFRLKSLLFGKNLTPKAESALHVTPVQSMPANALNASDVEANLKAMLLRPGDRGSTGGNQETPNKPIMPIPPMMPSGKVTTLAELEAGMQEMSMDSADSATPVSAGGGGSSATPLAQTSGLGEPSPASVPPPHTGAGAQQYSTPPDADMSAFNKLLGMVKASGDTPEETPQHKNEGRPMSPVDILSLQKQLVVKQQQQLLQAELIKKLLAQQQVQQVRQQQQQQQQQLQAKLQVQQVQQVQQQQQHQKLQEQIMNFVKQNPNIVGKPPPSPIAPQMLLQPPPASPRCPSPNPLVQSSLLQAPPSPSPRAPSPIMFGSQPPNHLTAPSPIHPGQIQSNSQSLSPNTLQVNQGASRSHMRVPSPQELIVHTQAIMHNALIKRQLEDQKERFMKKQQEKVKSPNPLSGQGGQVFLFPTQVPQMPQVPLEVSKMGGTPTTSTPLAQQQNKVTVSGVPPSFTPTSVIRKMASEKVDEKDKNRPDGSNPAGITLAVPQLPRSVASSVGAVPTSVLTTAGPGNMSLPGGPQGINVLAGASQQQNMPASMAADMKMNIHTPRPLVGQGTMQHIVANAAMHQSQATSQHGRPIVKGSVVQGTGVMSPPSQQVVSGSGGPIKSDGMTRPIVGGGMAANSIMETLGEQAQRRQMPPPSPNLPRSMAAPVSSAPQFGVPITGRVPSVPPTTAQPQVVRPGMGVNPSPNSPLLMQRMVHPAALGAPATRGMQALNVQQINQLNQLSQLASIQLQAQQLQAQQRGLDPRSLATSRTPTAGLFPGQGASPNTLSTAMALNAALSRALSPQSPQISPGLASVAKHDTMGGPLSPGLVMQSNPSLNSLLNSRLALDSNLAKWFGGSDVLKQQLPSMPPLPTQGQHVLTVDEIERRQQLVPN